MSGANAREFRLVLEILNGIDERKVSTLWHTPFGRSGYDG